MHFKTLLKIAVPPLIVLLFHVIGTILGWYEIHWWMDIPAHFLGGFAIVWSFSEVLNYFKSTKQYSVTWKPLHIFLLLGVAGLAAATWELMEFAFDVYFHTTTQPGLLDTIKDICMGLSGGGLAAIITSYKKR
jgi:hypothetical protein